MKKVALFLILSFFSTHVAFAVPGEKREVAIEVQDVQPEGQRAQKRRIRDFFTGVFGAQDFHEEVNLEHFEADLELVKGLNSSDAATNDVRNKIILCSVFDELLYEGFQQNPEKVKPMQDRLTAYTQELKVELFGQLQAQFVSKHGRKPDNAETKELDDKTNKLFRDLFNKMRPHAKLPQVERMEKVYLKNAPSEKVRNDRHGFFEWMRERVLQDMQEADLSMDQITPPTGWRKYKKWVYRAAVAAAVVAGGYGVYRKVYPKHKLRGFAAWSKEERAAGQQIHARLPELFDYETKDPTKVEFPKEVYDTVTKIMMDHNLSTKPGYVHEYLTEVFRQHFDDKKVVSFQLKKMFK